MVYFWALVSTISAILAVITGYLAVRIWRSNPAIYDTNRYVTGSFANAATGCVSPLVSDDMTDFRINHFVDPCLTEDGSIIWERAGSLSDEAVDGVLARHR